MLMRLTALQPTTAEKPCHLQQTESPPKAPEQGQPIARKLKKAKNKKISIYLSFFTVPTLHSIYLRVGYL